MQPPFGPTSPATAQVVAPRLGGHGLQAGPRRPAAHDHVSDAVGHALLAGDADFAARLVETCAMPLIMQGHIPRQTVRILKQAKDLIEHMSDDGGLGPAAADLPSPLRRRRGADRRARDGLTAKQPGTIPDGMTRKRFGVRHA